MAVEYLGTGNDDGVVLGRSSTDLVAFYGGTPRARPSVPAAITDSSTGTANVATGVAALTGTYNSTILANAIATLAASINSIRAALVSVGIVA
jgi:hypothetical protein